MLLHDFNLCRLPSSTVLVSLWLRLVVSPWLFICLDCFVGQKVISVLFPISIMSVFFVFVYWFIFCYFQPWGHLQLTRRCVLFKISRFLFQASSTVCIGVSPPPLVALLVYLIVYPFKQIWPPHQTWFVMQEPILSSFLLIMKCTGESNVRHAATEGQINTQPHPHLHHLLQSTHDLCGAQPSDWHS